MQAETTKLIFSLVSFLQPPFYFEVKNKDLIPTAVGKNRYCNRAILTAQAPMSCLSDYEKHNRYFFPRLWCVSRERIEFDSSVRPSVRPLDARGSSSARRERRDDTTDTTGSWKFSIPDEI